jgi:hypothetical protein
MSKEGKVIVGYNSKLNFDKELNKKISNEDSSPKSNIGKKSPKKTEIKYGEIITLEKFFLLSDAEKRLDNYQVFYWKIIVTLELGFQIILI